MKFEQKKRFMRDKLRISTKDISKSEVNSFFKKVNAIKKKYS